MVMPTSASASSCQGLLSVSLGRVVLPLFLVFSVPPIHLNPQQVSSNNHQYFDSYQHIITTSHHSSRVRLCPLFGYFSASHEPPLTCQVINRHQYPSTSSQTLSLCAVLLVARVVVSLGVFLFSVLPYVIQSLVIKLCGQG
jgi:hypothetical protein